MRPGSDFMPDSEATISNVAIKETTTLFERLCLKRTLIVTFSKTVLEPDYMQLSKNEKYVIQLSGHGRGQQLR